jgi:hypothetical protein
VYLGAALWAGFVANPCVVLFLTHRVHQLVILPALAPLALLWIPRRSTAVGVRRRPILFFYAVLSFLPTTAFFLCWAAVIYWEVILWIAIGALGCAALAGVSARVPGEPGSVDTRFARAWFGGILLLLYLVVLSDALTFNFPNLSIKNDQRGFYDSRLPISSAPGVSVVAAVARDGLVHFRSGRETRHDNYDLRFDPYVILSHGDNELLVAHEWTSIDKINLDSMDVRRLHLLPTARAFFLDPVDDAVVYVGVQAADGMPSVAAVDINGWTVRQVERQHGLGDAVGETQIADVFADAQSVYAATMNGLLASLPRETGNPVRVSAVCPPVLCAAGRFSPRAHRAYLFDLLHVTAVDIPAMRVTVRRVLPFTNYGVMLPESRELLANGWSSIAALDDMSLRTKRVVTTQFCPRAFDFDPRRKWIYVVGYFSGIFRIYDYETGRLIGPKSLFLGPYARAVHYFAKRDRVYVGTSAGIFEIAPDVFVGRSPAAAQRDQ